MSWLPLCVQDSHGVFAAREFVWWYNAHPDGRQLPVDLSRVEAVAVCGIGNVALDCARLLLRPPEQLAATDIAMHALQQLKGSSRVREVHLCARRGPVQVSSWYLHLCLLPVCFPAVTRESRRSKLAAAGAIAVWAV